MKLVIAIAAVAAMGAVAATIVIGRRLAEPTVVADPYEEGLRYDEQHHHAHDVAAVGPRAPPRCDLARAPCARSVAGVTVTLEVTPRPVRAMRELEFDVRASPPEATGPGEGRVSLEMQGMYMGENRIRLAPAAPGAWQGRGTIVRCPSGRRGWIAEVEIPASGQPNGRIVASFAFEVAE
jgi:hypothetical protein